MALPGDVASTSPHVANFLAPYDRFKDLFTDYEMGGIALNDGSQGTEVQVWKLTYESDALSPTYGDFVLTPESYGSPTVIFNIPDVKEIGLAFNQNMDPFITYLLKDGACKYYYYDSLATAMVTAVLPAGSRSPACCLDDHHWMQTGTSDTILGYIRSGTVYYRQQRDRFLTERALGTGVGDARLYRVGMQDNFRLKFEVGAGSGNRLSQIVGDCCIEAGIGAGQLELDELYPTLVRGFWTSQPQAAADLVRGLQRIYFFDFPEYDEKLWGLMRGRDPVAWIPHDDLAIGSENVITTSREQELEFPRKVHLSYASMETDYAPTKQTSERLSSNVRVRSEMQIECFVNLEANEAAQRAAILHKSAWAEFEGRAEFGLSEAYCDLVPSDVVMVEIEVGLWKRFRIDELVWSEGILEVKAAIDRKSSWASGAVAPTIIAPEAPTSPLAGATTWEFMDLPALVTTDDALLYYVAGHGAANAWRGFELQRESGTTYQEEAQVTYSQTLGVLDVALAAAPREYKDTTNTITVTTNKALYAATYEELLLGKNAALVGDEIIQFQNVTDLGGGQWLLDTLLRGRLNTIPTSHTIAARFVLLKNPASVPADIALLDQTFNLRAVSYGTTASSATPVAVTFTGESQREWDPAFLDAVQNGSDWDVTWQHRKRLGNAVTPIDSINFEGTWRIYFTKGATTVSKESTVENYTYTSADQVTDYGSPQGSWDEVKVVAMNRFTGEGSPATGAF